MSITKEIMDVCTNVQYRQMKRIKPDANFHEQDVSVHSLVSLIRRNAGSDCELANHGKSWLIPLSVQYCTTISVVFQGIMF
ncbi:hypothetical protein HHK36_011212 [Tetracentron sinense]|uniref:Uncharacterized protein n=1 Tax=Tetracentron sinense TaxID=13715 RepID=A0A834ZD22_TETSI|nr:hypothetical protein HHK36_011212 [Tetracentron sinense]